MLQSRYDGFTAYRQSKLAQIMFTFELAERLRAAGETGVTVNALHPASLMPTKMVRESFGYTMSTIADGLEATRRLVITPELDGDRKSTRLNSSHGYISYAVFCLK